MRFPTFPTPQFSVWVMNDPGAKDPGKTTMRFHSNGDFADVSGSSSVNIIPHGDTEMRVTDFALLLEM